MSFILIHLVSPFCVSLPSLALPVSPQSFPACKIQVKLPKWSSRTSPLLSSYHPSLPCLLILATLLHLCPSLSSPPPCQENHPDLEGGIGISYNGWAARGSARGRGKDGRREYRKGKERWKRLLMREDRGTDTEIKLCRHWQGNWQDN